MEKLGFLAFLAPIIAFWGQIQNFIKQIFFIVIRKDTIEYETVSHELLLHFYQNGKAFYFGPRTWAMFVCRYLKKYNLTTDTIVSAETYKIFLYKNWIPVLVKSNSGISISVFYVLGTVNLKFILDNIVGEIYKERTNLTESSRSNSKYEGYGYEYEVIRTKAGIASQNKDNDSAKTSTTAFGSISPALSNASATSNNILFQFYPKLQNHYHFLGLNPSEIEATAPENKTTPNFFWSKEGLHILDILKYWLSHAQWFNERRLKHRYGILLYGKPGTGKSALVRQVAEDRKMSIMALELAGMTSSEFGEHISRVLDKTIILIEDIDCIFDGRKNISSNNNFKDLLSFDTLINIMSGVEAKKSVFWIFTTNNIDKIDPALLRPGRLDEKIEIGMLPKEGKEIIAKNILRDWPDLVESLVNEDKEYTAAEFEHKCIEIATEKFWKERKAETNE